MPELPEVETTMRLVRTGLLSRRIAGTRVHWPRTLGGTSPAAFEAALCGARIAEVRRRAKYIVLELVRDRLAAGALLIHLRMTGRLILLPSHAPDPPWTKVSLRLSRGTLHFVDVRKFGRVIFVECADHALKDLGPEPLSESFTAAALFDLLRSRARALKPLLLDQRVVAGLGNIYADEVLHRARLHPLRPSDLVSRREAEGLHIAIQVVLKEAILREGSSIDSFYRTPEGKPGDFQHQFLVYGRTGQPCRTCGTPIRRTLVGQRATHHCPRCQRAPQKRRPRP